MVRNEKLFITDLMAHIILDYLKMNAHSLFTVTANIKVGVL